MCVADCFMSDRMVCAAHVETFYLHELVWAM